MPVTAKPLTERSPELREEIAARGFGYMPSSDFHLGELEGEWSSLREDWDHLEVDKYMADGGRYRLRRYGRFFFVPATSELLRLPHALVYQSTYVNNFAGGIHRDFAPLRESTFVNPFLHALIRYDFGFFQVDDPAKLNDPWEIWIHQIRIQASGTEKALPAPEGIHHDGHDYICMHLVGKKNVGGGGSHIYDNDKNEIFTTMLDRPLDTIYADDHRVMHAVDPIYTTSEGALAERDILIIDFDYRPQLARPT